jgi:hypothetical protein
VAAVAALVCNRLWREWARSWQGSARVTERLPFISWNPGPGGGEGRPCPGNGGDSYGRRCEEGERALTSGTRGAVGRSACVQSQVTGPAAQRVGQALHARAEKFTWAALSDCRGGRKVRQAAREAFILFFLSFLSIFFLFPSFLSLV